MTKTREQKITEIMTLVGVAPRDFEAARRNYEKFNDGQIDRQLERLHSGKAVVEEWRNVRPAAPNRE